MTQERSGEETGAVKALAGRVGELLGKPAVDTAWLDVPLTHPSYMFEADAGENNQRLEFLGDAVLDFLTGEYLYLSYPASPEGDLTKMRAAVVNEATLARVARRLNLGAALRLGRGELHSGGRDRDSNLADALEALIGALYLRFGLDGARAFVRALFVPEIETLPDTFGDNKTRLQETAQMLGRRVSYRVVAEHGPDHCKVFSVEALVDGRQAGAGSGRTKKEAEQQAAGAALLHWDHQA
ncbi:MAG: ribonuclease III [Gracilibacteraceae bacterium]|jgi:ribonuclease-3|nr:ribonuclease III [Gracilibacteraceae bacterium]